jgi:hypothetical protein
MSPEKRGAWTFSGVLPATLTLRVAVRGKQRENVVLNLRLESGTARLLDLFGETPRLQATFNAQAVCDRKSVGGRRVGHGSTAPQRGHPEFLKGSAVEDYKIRHFLGHDGHYLSNYGAG